jgi:hypothetical protein
MAEPLQLVKSAPDPTPEQPAQPWVTLANALNRAAQGLTVGEKRLVMIAVAKLDPRTLARSPITAPLVTKVKALEYAEHAKVAMPAAYMALKTASQQLEERKITFFEDGGSGRKRGPLRVSMRWVGRATYHEGEGWVELAWWHEVMPYLTGIRGNFTQYQLQQAASLRSLYSWRLLELIVQHKDTGWLQIPIEEFCHAMDATEKQQENFNNLRRRMIEPAVKELDAKDSWAIQWEPIKAGRKVTALRFEFRRDDQLKLDLPKPPRPRTAPAAPKPQPRPAALDAPKRREPTAAELLAFANPDESPEATLARWRARGPAAALAALGRSPVGVQGATPAG